MINPVKALKKKHLAELKNGHFYSNVGYEVAANEKAEEVQRLQKVIERNRVQRALHELRGLPAGKSSSKRAAKLEKELHSTFLLSKVMSDAIKMRRSEARKLLVKRKIRKIVKRI
ncbi:MAG: hypothetical protein WC462_04735 [archaeon]